MTSYSAIEASELTLLGTPTQNLITNYARERIGKEECYLAFLRSKPLDVAARYLSDNEINTIILPVENGIIGSIGREKVSRLMSDGIDGGCIVFTQDKSLYEGVHIPHLSSEGIVRFPNFTLYEILQGIDELTKRPRLIGALKEPLIEDPSTNYVDQDEIVEAKRALEFLLCLR